MENEPNKKSGVSWSEIIIATGVGLVLCFVFLNSFAFTTPIKSAEHIKALNNARSIALALKQYAQDHNGELPSGNTAAEVFEKLLSTEGDAGGYLNDKAMFFVKGSQYTPKPILGGDPIKLASGENHFGVMGNIKFDDKSNSRWPLVFDGPATPDGRYSANPMQKGGVWGGKFAIVVRLDCSAKMEPLADLKVKTDGQENVLQPSPKWMPEAKLLMPY